MTSNSQTVSDDSVIHNSSRHVDKQYINLALWELRDASHVHGLRGLHGPICTQKKSLKKFREIRIQKVLITAIPISFNGDGRFLIQRLNSKVSGRKNNDKQDQIFLFTFPIEIAHNT